MNLIKSHKNILIIGLAFITSLLVISGFLFLGNASHYTESVYAANDVDLTGWLTNVNSGPISLSCQNNNTCGTSNYGVSIDTDTYRFSGYGWSSTLGWVNFNQNNNCPSGPGAQSGDAIKFNEGIVDTITLGGYIEVISPASVGPEYDGNWDGCIKLSGPGYGVQVIRTDPNPTSPKKIVGKAWNCNDVDDNGSCDVGLGWVHFEYSWTEGCSEDDPDCVACVPGEPGCEPQCNPSEASCCSGQLCISTNNPKVTMTSECVIGDPLQAQLTWESNNISDDSCDLYIDDVLIAENLPDDYSYTWNVPESGAQYFAELECDNLTETQVISSGNVAIACTVPGDPECRDKYDNDDDGLTDEADSSCYSDCVVTVPPRGSTYNPNYSESRSCTAEYGNPPEIIET